MTRFPARRFTMSRSQRDKGVRAEREIVDRHKAITVHAERYPLSGGSRFRGSGHDVDLYPFGRDAAPLAGSVPNSIVPGRRAIGNAAEPCGRLYWIIWRQLGGSQTKAFGRC